MIKLIFCFLIKIIFFNINILYFYNIVNLNLKFKFYITTFAKIILFLKYINKNIIHFS